MAKHAREYPPHCRHNESPACPADYPLISPVLIIPHQYMELAIVRWNISVVFLEHNQYIHIPHRMATDDVHYSIYTYGITLYSHGCTLLNSFVHVAKRPAGYHLPRDVLRLCPRIWPRGLATASQGKLHGSIHGSIHGKTRG